jgi:hypothetical protein
VPGASFSKRSRLIVPLLVSMMAFDMLRDSFAGW